MQQVKPQHMVAECQESRVETLANHNRLCVEGWRRLPADGYGYIDSAEFLKWPDFRVLEFVRQFETIRYCGSRNWNNLWRETLGLDSTHGKRILDYGCGFGIEALQFCKAGNSVALYDIHDTNRKAAERVLKLHGYEPANFFGGGFDVFYSNGCLHHTPDMPQILRDAVPALAPDGEIRLLLYSDKAWILKTCTPLPPIDSDVRDAAAFPKYVRAMDEVGEYADWYNREKLEYRIGDFLKIERFDYIQEDGALCTATLKPR